MWGTIPERVAIAAGPDGWLSPDGLDAYGEVWRHVQRRGPDRSRLTVRAARPDPRSPEGGGDLVEKRSSASVFCAPVPSVKSGTISSSRPASA